MAQNLATDFKGIAFLETEDDLLQAAIDESKETFESKRAFEELLRESNEKSGRLNPRGSQKKRKLEKACSGKRGSRTGRNGSSSGEQEEKRGEEQNSESESERVRALIPKPEFQNKEEVVVYLEGQKLRCTVKHFKRVVVISQQGRGALKGAKAEKYRYLYQVGHNRIRCVPLDRRWFRAEELVRIPTSSRNNLKEFMQSLPNRSEEHKTLDVNMIYQLGGARRTRRSQNIEDEAVQRAMELSMLEQWQGMQKEQERAASNMNGKTPCDLKATLSLEEGDRYSSQWVRRSFRNVTKPLQDNWKVQLLYQRIKINCPSLTVLKLKDYFRTDVNPEFMDRFLDLMLQHCQTSKCQGLYIHNFSDAITDEKLDKVITVLKHSKIWALNIGENYRISTGGWEKFAEELKDTWVTHLYMSEHVVKPELKTKMRDSIRLNRKKHDLHNTYANKDVINRITNMWWNPCNSQRFQREMMEARKRRDDEAARASK